MNAKYQWGYVAEGICASCNVQAELWTHSAKDVQYHNLALCAYCHGSYIKSHIYMSSITSPEFDELYAVNPIQSPEIYGERKPFCGGCGFLFIEESVIVDAQDDIGNLRKVHEGCTTKCDDCDEVFIASRYPYSFMRTHHGQFDYHMAGNVSFYTKIDGDEMCQHCYEASEFVQCENCSDVGDYDDFNTFGSARYCESCYDDNVYSCDDCDESYWDGDGHDCDSGVIKNWDYKPDPQFFKHTSEGTPTYYLGLELEVENTRESVGTHDMAEITQEFLGSRAYLKHDGSIADGFEIVTHPHTLESMRYDFNWSVLERLREEGFRSWNASNSSCGIHVHVSRTAFGQNDRRRVADHKRDSHMLRFMKLIYDNQRQVERLAGRQSNRWANFADKGQLVRKVKHGNQENGRYSAVNTDNYATLEVRVFKGSLKKERVLSALEFVTASVEYTRDLKVTATNKALTWAKFVSYVVSNEDKYPNLLSKISDSLASETITN